MSVPSADSGLDTSLRVARGISVGTFPPVLALLAFLVLDATIVAPASRPLLIAITIVFGTVWPIGATLSLLRDRGPAGIEGGRARTRLLGVSALGYGLGAGLLFALGAPALVALLMTCYATNSAVMLLINLSWKASVHAMGVAGPTVALIFALGLSGALLSVLLPIVAWSRHRLGAHTWSQVVAGAALGYLLTGSQIVLGLRLA